MALFLDPSALVKLVVTEAETPALRALLAAPPTEVRTTSAIARCEVPRAVARRAASVGDKTRAVLVGVRQIAVTPALLDRAAGLEPASLRSLAAIHLASALDLGADLSAFVTYDARQRRAARDAGVTVLAPA